MSLVHTLPSWRPSGLADLVIANLPDGIAVIDDATRYTLWNPQMAALTGESAADMLGTAVGQRTCLVDGLFGGVLPATFRGEKIAHRDVSYTGRKTHGRCDTLAWPLWRDGQVVGALLLVRPLSVYAGAG